MKVGMLFPRPGAPDALRPDMDAAARAIQALRELRVGHVQLDRGAIEERAIDLLLAARGRHPGGG